MQIVARTTHALAPHEGLTIALGFPKGVVAAPTNRQRLAWFLGDNAGVLALAAGLLLVLSYYLVQWSRVGRDPRPGTIIPLYEPPAEHTPGALRYVERMGWDDRCVAADIVDAAVRGAIRIADDDGDYRIERAGNAQLPPVESRLVSDLLGGASVFVFKQSAHARISTALDAHKKALKSAYADSHFHKNSGLIVIGALITVATVIGLLPAHIIYCWIGARLNTLLVTNPDPDFQALFGQFWAPMTGVFVLAVVLPFVLKGVQKMVGGRRTA